MGFAEFSFARWVFDHTKDLPLLFFFLFPSCLHLPTPKLPKAEPKRCCKARAVLPIHNTRLNRLCGAILKLFSLLPFDTPQNNKIVNFFSVATAPPRTSVLVRRCI